MRRLVASTAPLALSLAFLAGARPLSADSLKPQSFEEAIRQARLQIAQAQKTGKTAQTFSARRKDILKTSDRVFKSSPETARSLAHLRAFVASRTGEDDPESAPARDLLSADDPGLAALVGVSSFWHEAQHQYDRQASGMDAELAMSVEMEKRGWQAGCRFWKAGVALLLKPTGEAWPKSFFCEDRFPAQYYCRLYLSEEVVVLTARQLAALGRSRAQIVADLSPAADASGARPQAAASPFERILGVYCGELERSLRGNPEDLDGFVYKWSTSECVDRAVSAVLAPAWKSSAEQCPDAHPAGPDMRKEAGELRGWK